MRLHRFYVNKPLGEELVVERAGSDNDIVHQWLRVFRYTEGDHVLLFSPHSPGSDTEYSISSITKDHIGMTKIATHMNVFPSHELVLCMALVKKDTFETIVRQATELGVSKIFPVIAARSEKKSLNMERLEKIAIEASEQSGRGTVPQIFPISSIEETLTLTKTMRNIVGSLHGKSLALTSSPCAVWVGPEGGWTEEEETYFNEQDFSLLRSVPTTLKADTAAVNLLSITLGV